jgi:HlyD family secretion protein
VQQMRLVEAEQPPVKGVQTGAGRPHRRRRRLVVLAIAVGCVSAALLASWWWMRGTIPPRYLTAAVTQGTVARTVTATGTVNPVMTIIVGAYDSGVIRDVYCDYNTQVKKGQLCARIDPRPYEAALAQANGELARDSALLAGARVDRARYATLLRQNSVAEMTYTDEAAVVHELEGSVQLDRAAVKIAQVNLDYTNIVSPVDGTVVARNVTIGQTVASSFQTPTLFLIATDLTRMQVDTNVSESDIGTVENGDSADFSVEASPGRLFRGRIVQVRQAPQVIQNVVTYDAVVGADNVGFFLKPGMTATVAIVTAQRAKVLRVPDQALRFTPGGLGLAATDGSAQGAGPSTAGVSTPGGMGRVWVLRAGKPVAVMVRTGLDDGTFSEVVSGAIGLEDPVIIGEERPARGSSMRVFRFGL